jgi:SAM-dependent methyltransferase
MATARAPSASERVRALMTPASRSAATERVAGVLDVLGAQDPTGAHPGQQLMESRGLALIYERWWRPLGARLLMAGGPGQRGEEQIAKAMLALRDGDSVLDVACGTGAFSRAFARAVAPHGLVVGLDASPTMLERAVAGERPANLTYVRGDAMQLPFADGSFDAVCCFAALYLIDDAWRAIDEIVRMLGPGGRVGLMASVHRGPLPAREVGRAVKGLTGVRLFTRDELADGLRERGLGQLRTHVSGFAQFVSGRRAAIR